MKDITIDRINEDIVETTIDWLKGAFAEVDPDTGQVMLFLNLKQDDEDEETLTPIVSEDEEDDLDDYEEEDEDEEDPD